MNMVDGMDEGRGAVVPKVRIEIGDLVTVEEPIAPGDDEFRAVWAAWSRAVEMARAMLSARTLDDCLRRHRGGEG
jgi:hypothetical protein